MKSMLALLLPVLAAHAPKAEFELVILAGQSNAQGIKGNGAKYPKELAELDAKIPFYWVTPKQSSSDGKWTSLQPQGGCFKEGHFGLEISFARLLKKTGHQPAIFKYSLGSTSLAGKWKAPGQKGMYDDMVAELRKAVQLLAQAGHKVNVSGFIWIQGESDAKTKKLADAYYGSLKTLIADLRGKVTRNPKLPVILGVDEQHKWVKSQPQVVEAQQRLAKEDPFIAYTSMIGLEKADSTHLTPKGLVEHGKRIFETYLKVARGK